MNETNKQKTSKKHALTPEMEKRKWKEGQSGNINGRPKQTPEQKQIKKITTEIITEHLENLTGALPQISPVLIKKALAGDITAIKEIHDRTMGKPKMFVEGSANDNTINLILEKLADILK